ncbi:NFACT family protein, partial [Candidatus Bathyarchaeota archaeon]|nr:NFACT family protein [Candidatus Bathyarchaeota archaeon]
MSSMDIAAVTLELGDRIVGQRIDNIYHIIPKTFILRLRPGDLRLLIEIERRIHLTRFDYPTPPKPSNLCMTLRKYLNGGVVESVRQYEFERILNLEVSTSRGNYLLVAEIFRRGNLILVDPEKRVRLSLRYARMRDREVIRGVAYQPAPVTGLNPLNMEPARLQELRSAGEMGLLEALTSTLSFGPLYCREVILLSGLDGEKPAKDLSTAEIEALTEAVLKLREPILNRDLDPVVVYGDGGAPLDALPFPLKAYEGRALRRFRTYNEAADELYSTQVAEGEYRRLQASRLEEEARLQRILREQSERKSMLEEAVLRGKRVGDQIFLNLPTIMEVLETVNAARRAGSPIQQIQEAAERKAAELKPGMEVQVVKEGLRLSLAGETIQIRYDKTPQGVAEEHYANAKRATQKLRGLEESIREVESKLERLKTGPLLEKETVKIPTRMREKLWYEKFHWFKSSDGFLVLSGRDAQSNELLLRRYLQKQDLVFHAEIHGAPFTVVKTEGKTVPESTILEAAQAAASRSKAWSLDLTSLDVYWVRADQVGGKAPSGEYLGRGQFMVSGKRNVIRGVELRVAIGVVEEDEQVRIISGPPSAVMSQTGRYVEVVPGRTSSGRLAKKAAEILNVGQPPPGARLS